MHKLNSLPVELHKIVKKYKLLAAKRAEEGVKLFYAGVPVFLIDIGDCGTDVLDSIDKSMRDRASLAKVNSFLKKRAQCLDISSNMPNP
jgi:hypothetical protein